jgi:WD40 repeat protein
MVALFGVGVLALVVIGIFAFPALFPDVPPGQNPQAAAAPEAAAKADAKPAADPAPPADPEDNGPPPGADLTPPKALVPAVVEGGARDFLGNPLPAGARARLGAPTLLIAGDRLERVTDLTFSGDGKWLASASRKKLCIWDVKNNKQVLVLAGHQGAATSVNFFPAQRWLPPRLLISAGDDRTIRFWDLNTGKEIDKIINHPGAVRALAVSPDGKYIASAGAGDPNIYLWDFEDGKERRRWPAHEGPVQCLAFSGDSKTLATGCMRSKPADNPRSTLALWDVATGQRLHAFGGHTEDIYAMAWSANGRCFATSGPGRQGMFGRQAVLFWDPTKGQSLPLPKENFDAMDCRLLRVSADGALLAGAGKGLHVSFWDTRARAAQRELMSPQLGMLESIALSPDGSTLATGDFEGRITFWDVARRAPKANNVDSHTQAITSVSVSPDGKTIATTSADGTARLWDPASGKPMGKLEFTEGRGKLAIRHGAFAPDGRSFALVHLWEGITVWSLPEAKLLHHIQPPGRKDPRIAQVVFTPDGKRIGWDSVEFRAPGAVLWNLEKDAQDQAFSPGGQAGGSLALSPDGRLLAVANGTVAVWKVDDGKQIFKSQDNETSLAFSPGGLLLAKSNFRWTTVVDVSTGASLGQLNRSQFDHDSHGLAFSPDGRLVAIGDDDQVRLWELGTTRQHSLKGHTGKVRAVAFSPDGKSLVSGSSDGTALVWDLAGVLPPERPSTALPCGTT